MGKVRVKTLGDEELEKEQQKEAKKRKVAKKTAKAPGLKGGERVVAVGPSEEELEKMTTDDSLQTTAVDGSQKTVDNARHAKKATKKEGLTKKGPRHSKRYQTVAKLVDKTKIYPLQDAIALLPKLTLAKFDETVELHINTTEAGLSGTLSLPYGTGKKIRVAIVDDALISQIEKGKIDFDVLLAAPSMMPKLARVARVLGPRGLMPNPKNGTITDKLQEAAKKYEGGQTTYKTESKLPILHVTVGKVSFGDKKLLENVRAAIDTISKTKIKNVTLKSTMSPGIKVDVASVS